MNERIKLLAEHAGYKDLPTVRLAFQGFDKEKFAELIVKECMNVLAESREVRQTAYYYRNKIAEHFGVNE